MIIIYNGVAAIGGLTILIVTYVPAFIILIAVIDRIIDYSDSINIPKSIEHFEKGYREDVN